MIESKELFPKTLLADEIWITLNFKQKEMIMDEELYKNSLDYKKMEDDTKKLSPLMYQNSIGNAEDEEYEFLDNLTMSEFNNRLDNLEIRVDIDTASRLFNSLTLGNSTTLNITSFEIFIDTFQAKDEELQKVNKYLTTNKLRTSTQEVALKVFI